MNTAYNSGDEKPPREHGPSSLTEQNGLDVAASARWAEFERLWAEGDWEKIAAWQEQERQGIERTIDMLRAQERTIRGQ